MPINLQNILTETLKECLDSKGLNHLKKTLEKKEEDFKLLKDDKFSLLLDIIDQKKALF